MKMKINNRNKNKNKNNNLSSKINISLIVLKVQTADWRKLASDRVAVDVAVQVLKAKAILRHKAFTTLQGQ